MTLAGRPWRGSRQRAPGQEVNRTHPTSRNPGAVRRVYHKEYEGVADATWSWLVRASRRPRERNRRAKKRRPRLPRRGACAASSGPPSAPCESLRCRGQPDYTADQVSGRGPGSRWDSLPVKPSLMRRATPGGRRRIRDRRLPVRTADRPTGILGDFPVIEVEPMYPCGSKNWACPARGRGLLAAKRSALFDRQDGCDQAGGDRYVGWIQE